MNSASTKVEEAQRQTVKGYRHRKWEENFIARARHHEGRRNRHHCHRLVRRCSRYAGSRVTEVLVAPEANAAALTTIRNRVCRPRKSIAALMTPGRSRSRREYKEDNMA